MGIDEVGIDKVGIDEVGINLTIDQFHLHIAPHVKFFSPSPLAERALRLN